MRVLFVHPAPDRSEAALASGLVARGIHVKLLVRKPPGNLEIPGAEIEHLPLRGFVSLWSVQVGVSGLGLGPVYCIQHTG